MNMAKKSKAVAACIALLGAVFGFLVFAYFSGIIASPRFVWNKGWKTYESPQGYGLQYPEGWLVEHTQNGNQADRFYKPNSTEILVMSGDDPLWAAGKVSVAELMQLSKEAYQKNQDFRLTDFFAVDDPLYAGYRASGQMRYPGEGWMLFNEWGVFVPGGKYYTVMAVTPDGHPQDELDQTKTVEHFALVNAAEAGPILPAYEMGVLQKILALPEVRDFDTLLRKETSGAAHVALAERPTKEDGTYLIQVYEIRDNHTATFGWYRFAPETGQIYQEDWY